MEQAEAPWREKVRSLEGELAAAHEAANAQRREAERARSALESAAIESRAALRDAEVRHGTQVAELSAKLELLEASRSAGASGAGAEEQHERTRRLQREHAEATVRSRKLLEEIEELRKENDGLLSLRSELLQANAALQGEAKANARLASSEKQSLERRIQHLQSEPEASTAAQQRMYESQLHQEQDVSVRPRDATRTQNRNATCNATRNAKPQYHPQRNPAMPPATPPAMPPATPPRYATLPCHPLATQPTPTIARFPLPPTNAIAHPIFPHPRPLAPHPIQSHNAGGASAPPPTTPSTTRRRTLGARHSSRRVAARGLGAAS